MTRQPLPNSRPPPSPTFYIEIPVYRPRKRTSVLSPVTSASPIYIGSPDEEDPVTYIGSSDEEDAVDRDLGGEGCMMKRKRGGAKAAQMESSDTEEEARPKRWKGKARAARPKSVVVEVRNGRKSNSATYSYRHSPAIDFQADGTESDRESEFRFSRSGSAQSASMGLESSRSASPPTRRAAGIDAETFPAQGASSAPSGSKRMGRRGIAARNPPVIIDWKVNTDSPPKIFRDHMMYVEPDCQGRKHLIRNIKRSGAIIVEDIDNATHVIVDTEEKDREDLFGEIEGTDIWCVTTDWLEASWNAGMVLPELSYSYQNGVLQSSFASLRPTRFSISNERLTEIFTTAQKLHNEERTTYEELDSMHLAKYATYSIFTWKNLYKSWRMKNGRFAPNRKNELGRTWSADELDQIFLEYHPLSRITGTSYGQVIKEIQKRHTQFSSRQYWLRLYSDWRGHAKASAAPVTLDYAPYSRVFSQYVPMLERGVPLGTIISEHLMEEHPDHGHTLATWKLLFATWLRETDSDNLETSRWTGLTKQSADAKIELAKMFKHEFDSLACRPGVVGDVFAPRTGHATGTLASWYGAWRQGKGKFEHMDPALRFTGRGRPNAMRSESPQSAEPPMAVLIARAAFTTIGLSDEDDDEIVTSYRGERQRQTKALRIRVAKVFKKDYDSLTFVRKKIVAILAAKTGLPERTLGQYYGDWRGSRGQIYDDIPEELRFTGNGPPAPPALTYAPKASGIRAPRIRGKPYCAPGKLPRYIYMESEEMDMAKYVERRLPRPTTNSPDDWVELAAEHPTMRTADSYASHYRRHRHRINALIPGLPEKMPLKQSNRKQPMDLAWKKGPAAWRGVVPPHPGGSAQGEASGRKAPRKQKRARSESTAADDDTEEEWLESEDDRMRRPKMRRRRVESDLEESEGS